ncbi:zonular occludens toxin domain-containing protein [Glaciimonas immobilis]|uniref:Zona occludens toxin n=1 Tax=Glaciimonas immobilis TaxID=728004 RepID=A0A840RL18_9BURK|nr:zonular occludens toxin domain-containing protein [Glaciimonas immobilis]KAF3999448.1 zonular occludens toxin [Glaciimonas immobilis]MBB5198957.1 zona occludens toxin [Glaciimonas immobilis]
MLNLFTGLPGNGKTLYTLWYVKQWVERENREREKEGKQLREVFYHGINQLMLPWTKIDPTKWMDCPAGAIIVIDEAQFVFEKKPNGSKLPEWYSQLAVHRHLGFDIVLITQNPSLVDNFVRKLVGKHLHIVRTFGMERAVVHEWMSVRESPEKPSSRKDSIQHKWGYPKEVYTYYKSAEQHTVKRNIPMKVWGLGVVVILLCGLVYMVYGNIQKKIHPELQVNAKTGSPVAPASQASGSSVRVSYKNAMEDAKQFAYDRTARVQGLPQTAPRYDEMTKPVSVPVPAACISDRKRCNCYTQQATPINVPEILCRDIVARGFYMEFDPNGNTAKLATNSPGVSSAGAVMLSAKDGREVRASSANVPVLATLGNEDGYGVLGKHRGGAVGSK